MLGGTKHLKKWYVWCGVRHSQGEGGVSWSESRPSENKQLDLASYVRQETTVFDVTSAGRNIRHQPYEFSGGTHVRYRMTYDARYLYSTNMYYACVEKFLGVHSGVNHVLRARVIFFSLPNEFFKEHHTKRYEHETYCVHLRCTIWATTHIYVVQYRRHGTWDTKHI